MMKVKMLRVLWTWLLLVTASGVLAGEVLTWEMDDPYAAGPTVVVELPEFTGNVVGVDVRVFGTGGSQRYVHATGMDQTIYSMSLDLTLRLDATAEGPDGPASAFIDAPESAPFDLAVSAALASGETDWSFMADGVFTLNAVTSHAPYYCNCYGVGYDALVVDRIEVHVTIDGTVATPPMRWGAVKAVYR